MFSCQGTLARGLSLACYGYIIQYRTDDVNGTLVLFIVQLVHGVGGRVQAAQASRGVQGVYGRLWASRGVQGV